MAGIQECENCHAPLPLGAPGAVVECTYCRVQNRVGGATGVMHVVRPAGIAPPASPYGAPASPYGPPPSRGYGPPSPHVMMAPPVRTPSNPGAIVAVLIVFALMTACGMGMAVFMLTAVR